MRQHLAATPGLETSAKSKGNRSAVDWHVKTDGDPISQLVFRRKKRPGRGDAGETGGEFRLTLINMQAGNLAAVPNNELISRESYDFKTSNCQVNVSGN